MPELFIVYPFRFQSFVIMVSIYVIIKTKSEQLYRVIRTEKNEYMGAPGVQWKIS